MKPLLTFSNLTKNINAKELLSHCSATIHTGDFVMLTGRSGAGKSILLRALCGLQPIDAGQITLNGQTIQNTSITAWRHQVALIAQNPIMSGKTVSDTLELPWQFAFYQTRQLDKSYYLTQLKKLDKSPDFLQLAIPHLSGGEKQLVNLLRSLQLSPTLLLLDEPTAALDNQSRDSVELLVQEWLSEKHDERAVVWVSHDEAQTQLGNCRWVMDAGQLTELSQ